MKKSGPAAFLLELLFVLLFFSLSAAVTLQLFAGAHSRQRESALISEALERGQDVAECFRAKGTALFAEDWTSEEADGMQVYTRMSDDGGSLRMVVWLRTETQENGRIETGELRVYDAGMPVGGELCCLTLGRYSPSEEAALS